MAKNAEGLTHGQRVRSAYMKEVRDARPEEFAELAEHDTKAVKERLRRIANVFSGHPKPSTSTNFVIEGEKYKGYEYLGNYRETLVHDEGPADPIRFIIYADYSIIDEIYSSGTRFVHISMNGTFEFRAKHFSQQYTILFRHESARFCPAIYILMADKSQESYLKVFRVLRDFLKLNIASVILDFESAAVKAFQQVFPTTVVKLCYFHLAQNWWKQFRIVHNASKEVVKVCYYKLLCIVFLPAELICSAILYALADLPTGDRQRILRYVLRNYVEGRVAKPQLWLMKEKVQAALPRTNNNQEGFHYRWNSSFGEHKERPSFYVWVLSVHSMMLENHLELVRLNAGHAPSRPPKYDYDDIILSSLCAQDVIALSVKSWVDSAVNVVRRITPTAVFDDDALESNGGDVPCVSQTNGGNDTVVDVSSSEGIAEATGEVGPTPKKRRGASEQSTQNASTPWTSLTSRQGGRLSVTLENRQELLTTGSMIPDDIVDIWMEMLCQEAQIRSPQKVAVGTSSFVFQPVPASVLHSGELYVQPIIDPARQHFAATAVVDGQVYFMDSMNVHLPHDGFFVQAMRQLYGSREVLKVAVQQQEYGSNTCGLHAVARLTEVVLNRQWFTLTVFEESPMRYHAAQCISSGRVLRSPEVFPATPSMAFGPEGRIVI